jgi:hypothetical protein
MQAKQRQILFVVIAVLIIAVVSSRFAFQKFEFAPARAFLYRDEAPLGGLGAYGYLVFTRRPNESSKKRYMAVCGSYRHNLEPMGEFRHEERNSIMVTFWPLVSRQETKGHVSDCNVLISKYDYAFANRMASSVEKLGAEGPILIAWTSPFLEGPHGDALTLDVSDFAEEDLDRALGIWKDRVARDPATWQKGFNLVLVREAFRNLIQKHGEQIVSVAQGK